MARYFVRRGKDGRVEGPWDASAIQQKLASAELDMDAEALEAKGQSSFQLNSSKEWRPIADLFEPLSVSATEGGALKQAQSRVVSRYRDAYLVGTALVGIGVVIKVVGAVLACIIILGSLTAANGLLGGGALIVGIAVAAIAGGLTWVGGVIVAAQGQILRATLDTAVFNSPFLSDHERLDVMGLPRNIADRPV